ncbi:MAG: nucleotidyltransferase [Flavobacterium sp. BFFFF2]|nr:MAG: nucleotidyltransferase [Flavobacterium sp. BFFFF2]
MMINNQLLPYLPHTFELFKKHKVKNAYLFGSALTDSFNENSDVDLLINFLDYSNPLEIGQSIWDLEDAMEQLFNRKVDLLTERSLKNPYFIAELNNTKKLIYEFATK